MRLSWWGLICAACLFAGCGGGGEAEDGVGQGSKGGAAEYVGRWEGAWMGDREGKAVAVVEKTEDGFRAKVMDGDKFVVTWFDGVEGDDGLEFYSSDDAPDRYESKWRGYIPKGGGEFVGQAYPPQSYEGFELKWVGKEER